MPPILFPDHERQLQSIQPQPSRRRDMSIQYPSNNLRFFTGQPSPVWPPCEEPAALHASTASPVHPTTGTPNYQCASSLAQPREFLKITKIALSCKQRWMIPSLAEKTQNFCVWSGSTFQSHPSRQSPCGRANKLNDSQRFSEYFPIDRDSHHRASQLETAGRTITV